MSEEMRVVSCGCSVVLKLIAGSEPAADNTRLVRLGFDNWLTGVALCGVTSAKRHGRKPDRERQTSRKAKRTGSSLPSAESTRTR